MPRLLLLFCSLVLSLLWPAEVRSVQVPESDVYALLKRLELDRFQIAFLKRELELNPSAPQARRWADDLASLLVQELIAAESPESVALSDARLKSLWDSHPEIQTPSLQTAIAYADFFRVERLCQSAFDRPEGESILLAQSNLRVLVERLEKLRGEWTAQTTSPAESLSDPEVELDDSPRSELREREALLKQVQFLLAWLRFYDGVLDTSGDRRVALWRESNREFRAILQIPPDHDVAKIQADWFELGGPTLARVMLGLAITEQTVGNAAAAEYCFSLLSETPLPHSIRELASAWRLRAFVYADQGTSACEWLRSQRESGSGIAPSAAALAQVAQGIATRQAIGKTNSTQQSALLAEIIIQLVDANEMAFVDQVLNSVGELQQSIAEPFYYNWLAARRSFQRAETSNRSDDYAAAIASATTALQSFGGAAAPKQTAQIQSMIAWSLWRMGRATEAAREFRRLAYLTRSLDGEASAQAAWNGIQALIESPDANANLQHEIFTAFDEFARMHPQSTLLAGAQIERLRLEGQWQSNPQAIEQLTAIPNGDSRYGDAQWAICRVYHARFLDARSEYQDSAADQHFVALTRIVEENIGVESLINDRMRVEMMFLVVGAALRYKPPKLELAESWLARASEVVYRLGRSSAEFANFQMIRIRWAVLSNNESVATKSAQWLADQGATRDQRLAGMMYLSHDFEQAFAPGKLNGDLLEQGFRLHRRLTEELGITLPDLMQSQNALLALTRLAEIEAATDRVREADQHFNLLLAVIPDNLSILQKAARCKIQLEDYVGALELWRRIVRDEIGGNDWLEAKYHIVVCLSHTSPELATEVLEQTLSLAGDLPDAWQKRFDQLRMELKPN